MKIIRYFLLGLLACSSLAWGHAALLSTTPAAGEVLKTAPSAIVLTFSEPVGVTTLRLFDPNGHAVALKPSQDTDSNVRITVPKNDAQGSYLLSWRIVSADGHPVGGTLDYAVGAPSASNPAVAADPDAALRDVFIWLTRWLGYLCLFAAVGAACFRAANPDREQGWAAPFIGLGLVLLPAELALQGLDLLAAPWTGLAQAATWSGALASSYAATLGLDAIALLCAAATLDARRPNWTRAWGVLSLLFAGGALAISGHAGTAPPRWLSRPAVALHVMMVILWIGALIPLARSLKGDPAAPRALEPLARFSRGIVIVVTLLALSGLSLVWLQFDHPADLWRTAYGRVLIAKLALVGLLLCLAAWNRWRLTPAVQSGSRNASRQMRRAIGIEAAFAILILAVVSLWRFTPPPRNVDQVQVAAQSILPATTLGNGRVSASIQPGVHDWVIQLTQPDGKPFAAQGLSLTLSNPAIGIEAVTRRAQPHAEGRWQVTLPALPMGGHWQASVQILVDDFDQITLDGGHKATPPLDRVSHHHAP